MMASKEGIALPELAPLLQQFAVSDRKNCDACISRDSEDLLPRSGLEEPACVPLVQPGRSGGRQDDEGAFPLQRRLLAHVPRHRFRSLRTGDYVAAVGGRDGFGGQCSEPCPGGVRIHRQTGGSVLRIPRSRRGPRGPDVGRDEQELGPGGQGTERRAAADGNQAAMGDSQPVQQSPFHAWRFDQLQRGRFRVRRSSSEESPGGHQGVRRRQLRVLGRTRRLSELVQHGHEARIGPHGASCTWRSTMPRRSASRVSF
jgi:hypothetical protein